MSQFPTFLASARWLIASSRRLRAFLARRGPRTRAVLLGAGVGLLIVLIWSWRLGSWIQELEFEVQSGEAEVEQLVEVIKEIEDYKAKKVELEPMLARVKGLKSGQGANLPLEALSRSRPPSFRLGSLDVEGELVSLQGTIADLVEAESLLRNLEEELKVRLELSQERGEEPPYRLGITSSLQEKEEGR